MIWSELMALGDKANVSRRYIPQLRKILIERTFDDKCHEAAAPAIAPPRTLLTYVIDSVPFRALMVEKAA